MGKLGDGQACQLAFFLFSTTALLERKLGSRDDLRFFFEKRYSLMGFSGGIDDCSWKDRADTASPEWSSFLDKNWGTSPQLEIHFLP